MRRYSEGDDQWRCGIGARGAVGLVVGVDAGGTNSRAAVVDLALVAPAATGAARADRALVGTGRSTGGNPIAHGAPQAAQAITVAIAEALGPRSPADVRRVVVGMAGDGLLNDPCTAGVFAGAWARAGLSCPIEVVGDAVAALASATSSPDGTVLIAGTGASASHIEDRTVVEVADGLGWLLGDEGAGFWLGRGAVRATVEALSGRAPAPRLAPAVCQALGAAATSAAVITAAYAMPPLALAALAPLVTAAARDRDPAALTLVSEAGDRLVATALKVRGAGPLVLAGACLGADSPIADVVAERLAGRADGTGWESRRAGRADLGAAWLAAVAAVGMDEDAAGWLHEVLVVG